METINIVLRVILSIMLVGIIGLAISSKEFHETIKFLIRGE